MPSLYAIAVIGRRGQLVTPADTPWFREMTWGKVVIADYDELPYMPGRYPCTDGRFPTPEMLHDYVRHTATENIFLIGGAEVFDKFAGVVDRWYVNKINYDGPADSWFNPMWLVAEPE